MARITLNGILWAAIFLAFILPMIAYISTTLPAPTNISPSQLANLTSTSNQINASLSKTYNSLNTALLGSGNGFCATCSAITGVGIFIINGFGTMMTVITQVPQLDQQGLNVMLNGMSTILPQTVIAALRVGVLLLYFYMAISLLALGASMIMKYSMMDG